MADLGTVARPYAQAIFDVARSDERLSEWSAALAEAARIVSDPAAREFLSRPDLRANERAAFMADICTQSDDAGVLAAGSGRNLLTLLAENDRLAAIPEISKHFDELKSRAENRVKVTLVSASAVDDALAATVTQSLKSRLGRDVDLTVEVDPTLMGGAIVKAEDRVIDGSVRSRLARLAESLIV